MLLWLLTPHQLSRKKMKKNYKAATHASSNISCLITTILACLLLSLTKAEAQVRAADVVTNAVAGLTYQYYELSNLSQLPAFASLTPTATGVASSPDVVAQSQRDYGYALRYSGFITVPTDGQYTFFTNSDDGSQLFIGSTLVVDNDGGHGLQERTGTIGLQAGTHAITITYFQNGGGRNLLISYFGPGLAKRVVPASSWSRSLPSIANVPPMAMAGATQTLTLPVSSTVLKGSGTDSDGSISAYAWSQIKGPNDAKFSAHDLAQISVSNLMAGVYVFELLVTDNQGISSSPSYVSVTVACPSIARPIVNSPVAYCVGSESTTLSTNVSLSSGATLRIYATATGTTPLPASTIPTTAEVGSTSYYVAQAVGTCESERVALVVTVAPSLEAPKAHPTRVINDHTIATWGDSFLEANFGLMPKQLSQMTGREVYAGGIGGQTSVQIKERMLAAVDKTTWPTIIWAGRNDSNNPAQVKASIASMVASLGHTSYLVLSIFNGEGEGTGTVPYQQVTDINRYLSDTYCNHYLDLRTYIVSQYDLTQPADVADHAADIPPQSLRQDFLHPNSAGTTLMSNYIYAHITNLLTGDVLVRTRQNSVLPSFSNLVAETATGATLKIYNSATNNTPLGLGNQYAPPVSRAGTFTYYVSQQVGNCESTRLKLIVVVDSLDKSTARAINSATAANNSVLDKTPSQLDTYSLLRAYPNPFTDELVVEVNFSTAEHYKLALYNVQGQLLRQIATGQAEPIRYQRFTMDSHGLPPGLYILHLTTATGSKRLRCVLSR
ncbi:MAG: T9SS type A sorting domain-containing protein [Hymenobacter sp.]|nr:MAG: T9SS type A sorting domain-containing protein [Hymenobacter sp.]